MLLNQKTLQGIAEGRITLAFRRWKRPMVKPGGRQRTSIGVLEFGTVKAIDEAAITDAEARKAGEKDREALLKRLRPEGQLYRVELAKAGEDPRIALREQDRLSAKDVETIRTRLERMDKAAANGPWTANTLELIAKHPEIRATDLAPQLQQERLPFKANVRKLKELGLTISLERGYRLSPRGEAYLRSMKRARRR
jgi:hypothetical protein